MIHISLRSTEPEPLELEPLKGDPAFLFETAKRFRKPHAQRLRDWADFVLGALLWAFGLFGLFAFLWICGAVFAAWRL